MNKREIEAEGDREKERGREMDCLTRKTKNRDVCRFTADNQHIFCLFFFSFSVPLFLFNSLAASVRWTLACLHVLAVVRTLEAVCT